MSDVISRHRLISHQEEINAMITAILKHLFNSTVFKSICQHSLQMTSDLNQGHFGNYADHIQNFSSPNCLILF